MRLFRFVWTDTSRQLRETNVLLEQLVESYGINASLNVLLVRQTSNIHFPSSFL